MPQVVVRPPSRHYNKLTMKSLVRPLLLIAAILFVPVLPLLVGGTSLEAMFTQWLRDTTSPLATAALVVVVLAVDIFLPVPSSLVSTLAGGRLGWWAGTLAVWAGMTIGAVIGFALARRWGRPLAERLAGSDEIHRLDQLSGRYGPALVVMTRPVPVLAEASVLLVGVQQLAWRRFLPGLAASNLGLALAYAVFGDIAAQHHWLPWALAISLALPMLLLAIVRAGTASTRLANEAPMTDPRGNED